MDDLKDITDRWRRGTEEGRIARERLFAKDRQHRIERSLCGYGVGSTAARRTFHALDAARAVRLLDDGKTLEIADPSGTWLPAREGLRARFAAGLL